MPWKRATQRIWDRPPFSGVYQFPTARLVSALPRSLNLKCAQGAFPSDALMDRTKAGGYVSECALYIRFLRMVRPHTDVVVLRVTDLCRVGRVKSYLLAARFWFCYARRLPQGGRLHAVGPLMRHTSASRSAMSRLYTAAPLAKPRAVDTGLAHAPRPWLPLAL